MKDTGPARVLIVDESPQFRRQLTQELEKHSRVTVIASAGDALEARQKILEHRPDVITLDLELPKVNALTFLRSLRQHYPVPVIICSGHTERNGTLGLKAIELGALDIVTKPLTNSAEALRDLGNELAVKICMAHNEARPVPRVRPTPRPRRWSFSECGLNPHHYLVAIGASTGGTEALRALLVSAPPDFPPTVIVQHMPAAFTANFAQRLDQLSELQVSEAREGDVLYPGRVLVARGDTHLIVRRMSRLVSVGYTDQLLVNRHCPSVDVLFDSVAHHFGSAAVGVLLTGMGTDGAHGLLRMRARGALTIAQDQRSSVVYGMPKAALRLGAVGHIASPDQIPALIQRFLSQKRVRAGEHSGLSRD
ncbi:MAG: chemotaxis-specific protein-glutamate methyltransferase CheB [Planctomycetota bacterium]